MQMGKQECGVQFHFVQGENRCVCFCQHPGDVTARAFRLRMAAEHQGVSCEFSVAKQGYEAFKVLTATAGTFL